MPQHSSKYIPIYAGKFKDDGFPDRYKHKIIRTRDEFLPILQEYNQLKERIFSFDFETTTLDIENQGEIVGASFTFDGITAYYLPFSHKLGENADPELIVFFMACIKSAKVAIAFNAEFEYRCIRRWGYDIKEITIFDAMGLIWNVDTNSQELNLKHLEKVILGWDRPDLEETFGKGLNPSMVPPEDAVTYAGFDSISPFLFYKIFSKYIKKNDFLLNLDMSLIQPIMNMEDYSFQIDKERLKGYEKSVLARLQKSEREIYDEVGYVFSIDSPAQLASALEKAGVDTGERTKKGQMKTGADLLAKIEDTFPVAKQITQYKKDQKLLSSYIRSFLKEIDKTGNNLHFKYFLFRVPSARLAAGGDKKNPYYAGINIQNIPKPKEIKYVFKDSNAPEAIVGYEFTPAPEGAKNVVEGKKQEENVRSCVVLPKDYYWVSCDFCIGGDTLVETTTGPVSAHDIYEEMRKGGKTRVKTPLGNYIITRATKSRPHRQFRILLGNSVELICSHLHRWLIYREGCLRWIRGGEIEKTDFFVLASTSKKVADFIKEAMFKDRHFKKQIDLSSDVFTYIHQIEKLKGRDRVANWWKSVPKLKKWVEMVKREAKKNGYVENYFGRRRHLSFWYKSGIRRLIGFADRSAVNHKIQSTGGDVMRIDLVKLYREFVLKGQPGFHMLSSIHDEINMAIHRDVITELVPAIVETMEFQMPGWPIKLTVGIEIGWSWGSTYKFKLENNKLVPDSE